MRYLQLACEHRFRSVSELWELKRGLFFKQKNASPSILIFNSLLGVKFHRSYYRRRAPCHERFFMLIGKVFTSNDEYWSCPRLLNCGDCCSQTHVSITADNYVEASDNWIPGKKFWPGLDRRFRRTRDNNGDCVKTVCIMLGIVSTVSNESKEKVGNLILKHTC